MRNGIRITIGVVLVAISAQQVAAAPGGRSIACPADSPLDRQVHSLVGLLIVPDEQAVQFAVSSLGQLPQKAEPSIACRLEDLRPLQVSRIYFLNSPGHWELFATYGPELVIDVLAAVLSSPDGDTSVCSLHNGATREARSACAAA